MKTNDALCLAIDALEYQKEDMLRKMESGEIDTNNLTKGSVAGLREAITQMRALQTLLTK